jgi:putative redox protein
MADQRIHFKNKDQQQLAARLALPPHGRVQAYTLFAHCFTCTKNLKAIKNINRALTQAGFAVLSFDFTGLGESEGDFADTNFSSNVEDLEAAAAFLEKEYEAPRLLIGHSLGGTAVLMASRRMKSADAVVTIGAPAEAGHVSRLFAGEHDAIRQKGEAEVSIGGRPFLIKKQFLDDLEALNREKILAKLNRALLVMHAPGDKVVGIDNAATIYQEALHPKSYISLDTADHLLSRAEDSLYAGSMIAAWVSRYLDRRAHTPLTTDKQVVSRTADSFTTEIQTDQHDLLADEPLDAGGEDLGPSPYELLNASLGACTGMTLRMYANHKKWPLDEVRVHLQHQKIHAKDCEGCENSSQKIDVIERVIELEGDLTEAQRKRLMEIARKCPVHKTLSASVKVESYFREQDKQKEKE